MAIPSGAGFTPAKTRDHARPHVKLILKIFFHFLHFIPLYSFSKSLKNSIRSYHWPQEIQGQ
jgi:hypothetical protein